MTDGSITGGAYKRQLTVSRLSINRIALNVAKLSNRNSIQSYRSWFELFTRLTLIQLGVWLSGLFNAIWGGKAQMMD